MTLVLPDTSVWSRLGRADVGGPLGDAIDEHRVIVSAPVVLELLRSARDRRELHAQAERYDALERIEMTPEQTLRAREVQAILSWRGYHRGPSAVDLLVAAAAESAGAELWHCDRHFELIAAVTGQPVRRLCT